MLFTVVLPSWARLVVRRRRPGVAPTHVGGQGSNSGCWQPFSSNYLRYRNLRYRRYLPIGVPVVTLQARAPTVSLGETIEEHYGRKIPFNEFMADLGRRSVRDIELGELVNFLHRHLSSRNGA